MTHTQHSALSLQFKLSRIELVVPPLFLHELGVAALLHDLAVLDDHDAVGVAHGGQPVGDDEHRPALHEGVHTPLDVLLGAGVDGGGGLVQH